MRFTVWAPRPARVDLVLDGETIPMSRDDGGWWIADAPGHPGHRYGFSLDGGPPRPDPRAVSMPDGADGLSAVYDHGRFVWHDDGWTGLRLPGSVLYELHVGTFSTVGTFAGAIEHLPHLVDLGIDAIELLPVATASGDRGWGYDGVDLFAPHPAYGGPDGLKAFVDACHAHGLAVLIDVVYNHLGPSGNYLGEFGPYFTDRHTTAWGDAVNVDGPDAAEVRRFFVDNACSWIRDFHCDGLRLDAVHAIVDDSERHLLAELAEAVHALGDELGRDVAVIAESETNDPTLLRPRPEGHGLDAVWSDDWHHALHTVLTGEREGYYRDFGTTDDLLKALQQAWVYDGRWSEHQGAVRGGSVEGLAPSAFLIAVQNHDQIGNRATGERLGALTTWGRLHAAAALLLTSPFTPMLFQGEEWGATTPFQYFTDHRDPDLARAVSEGRTHEFGDFGWAPEDVPDPQDPATFERSKLDWDEPARSPHAALLAWYRALIVLRSTEPDLVDATIATVASWDDGLLTVRRGSVTVLVNLGEAERTMPTVDDEILLASDESVVASEAGLQLPVDTTVVLKTASDSAASREA